MSGRLERAAAYFVTPVESASVTAAAAVVPVAARAVVIGRRDDVPPLAAAVALTLRASDRAPAAVVAVWSPDDEPAAGRGGAALPSATRSAVRSGAALPSATRVAGRLAERELTAAARGRLAWIALPAEPADAASAVRRAAALVDAPFVTALAAARPPELDELAAGHDVAVIAAIPDTPLARAAVTALRDRGVDAVACSPLARGLSRSLALAGLRAPRLTAPLRSRHGAATLARVGQERR